MRFIRMRGGEIGLAVELPAGPQVVDLANSLGVLAGHDLASGGLINGALKERSPWGALVANWQYLRSPLTRLARIAAANPDHPCLVLHSFADRGQNADGEGIVALEITDASDLESPDPTGRLVMARQFTELAVEPVEQDVASLGDNVQVVDFSHRNDPHTRRK